MSNIPKARDLLAELMLSLREQGLHEYADQLELIIPMMIRDRYKDRVKPQSQFVTTALAIEILQYAQKNQHLSAQAVANKYGVNPGRVSEILKAAKEK